MISGAMTAKVPTVKPANNARDISGKRCIRPKKRTVLINKADKAPKISPSKIVNGMSHNELILSAGTSKAGSAPYTSRVTTAAETELLRWGVH